MRLVPGSYLTLAAALLAATLLLGLQPELMPSAEADPWAAALARRLASLPMPMALALLLGVDAQRPRNWSAILVAMVIVTSNDHAVLTFALAFALALAVLPAIPLAAAPVLRQDGTGAACRWVAGLMAAGCTFRLLALTEPFERDLMVYATVASGWLEGLQLYADLWDHKPPGVYVAYGAAIALFGQTPLAIWALGAAMFVLTLLGVERVARQIAGPRAGLVAGVVWLVCGNDPLLQANQPNVEVFLNACIIWALAFLLTFLRAPARWMHLLVAGALFFIASSFKQIAVFPAALAGLWLLVTTSPAAPAAAPVAWRMLRVGVPRMVVLGLVGLAGWILVFAVFNAQGTFDAFYYATFTYNQGYSGSVFENLAKSLYFDARQPYYYALCAFFFSLHLLKMRQTLHGLLATFYLGAFVMIAAPGKFYPHYFQLVVPLISVSAGMFLAGLAEQGQGRWLTSCAVLLAPVWISFGYFTTPERVAFVKYGRDGHGGEAYESREIGRWLATHVDPQTKVLHWGAEPGIYFWSGQPSFYRHSFSYPLFSGARAGEMTAGFIRQISCNPPEIVIVKKGHDRTGGPVLEFLSQHYSPASGFPAFRDFSFWTARGTPMTCGTEEPAPRY